MAKKISVEIAIGSAKLTKTVDLAVGESAQLVATNQLRTVITERGTTYTVTITGYWKNAYQQVDINETLTYVWADHTDIEVVPGYAATCTEPGLTDGQYCHGCEGTTVEQTEIPALGHTEEVVAGTAATCTEAGLTDGVACSVCGETITAQEEIPALGHTEEVVAGTAATCTEAGLTDGVVCSVCGETITAQEEIPATGHNYVDGTCSCGATEVLTDSNLVLYKTNTSGGDLLLGDDIRASFIVNAKNLSYDRIYLEIVLNGESTIVEKLDNSTATVLRYAYVIPAAYMTSDVLVTVYGVKGEEVYRGEVLEFSVRKCIDAKMVNWVKAGSTANCNLAMALLDYGAKAQIQFKINTDNLATANLPEEYQQYLPNSTPALGTAPAVDTTGKTMTILNMGTLLQEKVKLSTVFRSTTAISDYSKITIEVKHHRSKDGEEILYTFTSADTDYVEFVNNKNIRFYFDKIAPSQMRDELEITVYYDGVAVSPTYVRSVDMILNNANYLNNETMCALVYAIMNYGDAAKALFG